MMALACVSNLIAAGIVLAIVLNLSALGTLVAFLLSWLALCFGGGALVATEHAARKGAAQAWKRWAIWLPAILLLSQGVKQLTDVWSHSEGFWTKAFLVWIGLISIMIVWVPVGGGKERYQTDEPPRDA